MKNYYGELGTYLGRETDERAHLPESRPVTDLRDIGLHYVLKQLRQWITLNSDIILRRANRLDELIGENRYSRTGQWKRQFDLSMLSAAHK